MNDIILDKQDHELSKFTVDANYHKYVQELLDLDVPAMDLLHQNTAFAGQVSIARTLSLYELYKKTTDLAGHVAEVGVWKGASFLLLAKLIGIFEPHSNTLVHGFDNFQGMTPAEDEKEVVAGSYKTDYETLRKIIDIQEIGNIARLHKLDVTKDLDHYFDNFKGTRFKLVFLDAGVYEVLKHCIPAFWDRMVPGGIMVFDQFNYESGFGETNAVREFLPDEKVEFINWSRSPSGYIVKK